MPAWWSGSLADFLVREPEEIVGSLATRLVEAHSINRDTQVRAWRAQIKHISTSHAELQNRTMRTNMLRFTRLNDGLS